MKNTRSTLAEQGLTPLNINWDVVAALVLFFASFALYARTATPGVLDGDGGEFQTNIYLLGVSHTGYPLYFLLAKLWTLLMPVGSIAYRANVFSCLFGALTLVLLYFTLRTLDLSRVISLGVSVLFGVSRVQWSQAIIPDVYTLNSFFIVLVLWLAILWRLGRVPLWAVALAYGLSLTHHRTMIWFAPPLGLFALWGGGLKIFQPRELAKTIAALFLPLLLYLYIPLRGESFVGVEYHPGNNINIFALNAVYDLRFGPIGFIWERITQVYLALLIEQFTVIGFVFGLVGIAALATKRVPRNFPAALAPRQLLLLIGLAHLLETAFAIVFWVVDSEIFFIPSFLTFLFFSAIGFAVVLEWSQETLREVTLRRTFRTANMSRLLAVGAAILFVALCGYLVWTNFARDDASGNDEAQARWQAILSQPLEEGATLIGPWQDLTPLEYYQNVEKVRPDLYRLKVILFQDQLKIGSQGDVAAQVRSIESQGGSAYLTVHPDDTETLRGFDKLELVPFDSLWRIDSKNNADSQPQKFGADDELRSLTALNAPVPGNFINVALNWSADTALDKMRLVLELNGAEQSWVQQETLPLGGRTAVPNKKTIRDVQGIMIPPDAPPGNYTFQVSAFERESNTPVSIVGDSNFVTTTLHIPSPPTPTAQVQVTIPHPLPAQAGDAKFLGYDVSQMQPSGGDILEFSSWWQNIARADDTFEIKLQDAEQVETVLYQGALLPNASGTLNPEQIVRARQEITIPPQAATGYARLVFSLNGQALPPIRIPLGESKRRFRYPIIQRPQLTLVGDSLQLLGYNLGRTAYRAGDTLPLTLYWSTDQTPPASYKVFVHLVDASGALRAQVDSIPKNGTLATNRWFPGEYVTDDYTLSLPHDLPPGNYHLQVGMYEEQGGVRVLLKDANNAPLADNAVTLDDVIVIQP